MALVASILNDLKECLSIAQSTKTIDKSKVKAAEEEASDLFQVWELIGIIQLMI
jgi:hypothetical protein